MFEDKTRQVPWRYDIFKLRQASFLLHAHLIWHILFLVTIQLCVAFVETLTDDEDNLRTLHRTAIHLHLTDCGPQFAQLLTDELVAAYGECQAHWRLV